MGEEWETVVGEEWETVVGEEWETVVGGASCCFSLALARRSSRTLSLLTSHRLELGGPGKWGLCA